MITVPLDKKKHNRKRFDCGVVVLKNHLRLMANQQSAKDNSRTYVLENNQDTHDIIGYYTLSMASLDLSLLPEKLQKKHLQANAAGLVARLAVDKRYTKQGYGEWLLIDALKKLFAASESIAFPLIVVDAKAGAVEFYKKFGFTAFQDESNKLFITMADVRESFTE